MKHIMYIQPSTHVVAIVTNVVLSASSIVVPVSGDEKGDELFPNIV